MKTYEATEQAYKNGYEKGYADGKRDAVEVVHGRWIKDGDVVVCSNCGEEHAWDEYRATYCEDCGAKMDGGNEDG